MTFNMQPGNGKLRANPQIVQTAVNNYDMVLGAQTAEDQVRDPKGAPNPATFTETIHFGNPAVTSSYTPVMTIPRASWVSSPCSIKIQMIGPNALFTSSSIVTANAITGLQSVRAVNASLQIDHSPVGPNAPFNEWGGLDHTTKILKSVGTTLTYQMTLTNCQAFLQPSLTKEWAVGQDLGNGNTVASVTDTDVTDNLGNNVAHRPRYVVGALVFMHSSKGGMVVDTDAALGLTTGEVGVLYARIATDSSPTPQTGYTSWSFNGSTLTETLPTFVNPVYPIVLSPAGDVFGYTTAGSSNQAEQFTNYLHAFYPFPSTSNAGTATTIQYYGHAASGSISVQMAIYTDGATGNKVTNSVTGTVAVSSAHGWWSGSTGSATIAASTNYDLAWQSNSPGNSFINYDSIANYYTEMNSGNTYGTWNASYTWGVRPFYSGEEFSIYCTYTAGGGVTISNSPSSLAFGVLTGGSTYYAYNQSTSTGYSNPVTAGQCYFTITNGGSGSVNLAMSCSNATGGNTWTLVSSAPSGDQFEIIAVYQGENPASGLVLTGSNQAFYASLAASGTLNWDFKWITGGSGGLFDDSATKTFTITITGS